ncbi:MAG: enoyl-CoA hydratase-related protein [Candidatus Binatia bacterium]
MAYEHILVDVDGDLGIVTMNRPARRNALSEAHMHELIAAFEGLATEAPVRAIVLAANGPVFSAGHDFSEVGTRDLDGMRRLIATSTTLMRTMQAVPQPVVACVHAIATAGGCQLALSADLVVAADVARFATPGGREGWFCITPMIPVQRLLPSKRALEMLFTGDEIDAATALAWGLVNRVVPQDRVLEEAKALARRASRGSFGAKALGKRMFYETVDLDEEPAYEKASEAMASSALTDDAREWVRSFLEKRPAVYPRRR